MNRYDRKLYSIMKKYGIYRFLKPKYTPYLFLRIKIYRFLKFFLKNFSDKKFLILTDDYGAAYFGKKFGEHKVLNFANNDFSEIQVSEFETAVSGRVEDEALLIFAFPYRINQCALGCAYSSSYRSKIVNIYDYMRERGIDTTYTDIFVKSTSKVECIKNYLRQIVHYYEVQSSFFRFVFGMIGLGGGMQWILEVYCTRQAYLNSGNSQRLKKRYFAQMLQTKDFLTLIEESFECDEDSWERGLMSEINGLINEINVKILSRCNESVIWNWVDNVSFETMHRDMPWLCENEKESISFENVYAMMPWTSWTFKSIFSGERVIRNKIFLKPDIGTKQGVYKFYDYLYDNKFKVFYLGLREKAEKMNTPFEARYGVDSINQVYRYGTENQWRALTLLATKKQKLFLIIHTLYETHFPYITPTLDALDSISFVKARSTEKQKTASRKYVDKQLSWYSNYYGDSVKVFMSDHGDHSHDVNKNVYSNGRTHIFFFIKDLKHVSAYKSYSAFVSSKDEIEIMLRFIENRDIDDLLSDSVWIESYDTYSKGGVDGLVDKIQAFDKGEWMQFLAYRNSKELYVRFSDGEERYFILPDEDNNLANEKSYQERIKELREMTTDDFIDIYKYNFFVESRRLHEALRASGGVSYLGKVRQTVTLNYEEWGGDKVCKTTVFALFDYEKAA